MSTPATARLRWRADLHEYGAAALRSAGLNDMAVASETEAANLRTTADLTEALIAAKEGGDRDAIRAAKIAASTHVRALRESGTPRPGILNNFAEPSDDELIALGY